MKKRISISIGLLAFWLLGNSAAAQSPESGPTTTAPNSMKIKEGFKVELLYEVPKEDQGSWVSMCVDDQGRLIVSDQYGGLYRATVAGRDRAEEIEKIDVDMGHAQGLLYAFNRLYVVVNDEAHGGRGLYQVRDTDGDDRFDEVKLLKKFEESGGEHGPHAVVLGPDKQSLYIVVGNQTALPDYDVSRVPPVWGEDLLLPRIYGRGFMRGVEAPRGWIAKTDPEGGHWEIIATGFRNEYDAAFNHHGELFTYDADMEWDMNMPWYRPTRVCLVASGAEFGWRNGSGKWPVYYPDSLPPVLDIGPGSPTGVVFGYGAKFPAKYQQAFFICDWSYGKLYAAHLTPEGSAYTGEFEEFISGSPLPLTDIVVNPKDGAMYFAIGGRRTQSALYRVTYDGGESVSPAPLDNEGAKARNLRHSLEAFHGKQDPKAVTAAWKHLDHKDRFIRYAARVAIEHQDPAAWSEKALNESDPRAALSALLALARVGDDSLKSRVLDALQRLDWKDLSGAEQLELLRVYALTFIRMGEPNESERESIASLLNSKFPAKTRELNSELCQLLVYLQSPATAEKGVALLTSAPSQQEQIDYAKSLRLLEKGWTPDLRRQYFSWFLKAPSFRGGASFRQFLDYIKNDAVEVWNRQRDAIQAVIDKQPDVKSPLEIMAEALAGRSFVKEWTLEELARAAETGLKNRDFENGRKMFGAAGCFACHRFGNEGGSLGPDLSSAGGRFNARDLLESIIDPSKEVSDQYGQVIITMKDGTDVMGRIVNLSGDSMSVNVNMFDPNANENVDRKNVVSVEPSPLSMMPEGLLNVLNKDEILDLTAYLLSNGDPDHKMFR